MYKVTKYPHGTFSWAELASNDSEASRRFLTALFGWSHVDIPMGESMVYTMYSIDGENVAASPPDARGDVPAGHPFPLE